MTPPRLTKTPFKLDAKRLAVAHLLAQDVSVPDASQRTGVPERTIRDWQAKPEMQAKVYELQLALNGEIVNAVADQALAVLSYLLDLVHLKLPELPLATVQDVQTLLAMASDIADMRGNLVGKQQQFQATTMNQMNVLMAQTDRPPDMAKILKNVEAAAETKAEIREQFDLMMEQIAETDDDAPQA